MLVNYNIVKVFQIKKKNLHEIKSPLNSYWVFHQNAEVLIQSLSCETHLLWDSLKYLHKKINQIHKSLDATLCFESMSWYSDVSEAALHVTSGPDIFLYYRPRSQTLA